MLGLSAPKYNKCPGPVGLVGLAGSYMGPAPPISAASRASNAVIAPVSFELRRGGIGTAGGVRGKVSTRRLSARRYQERAGRFPGQIHTPLPPPALAAGGARMPPAYKVARADCRKYDWPAVVDACATDPPWDDVSAYKWLDKFERAHVKPRGLLLVQVSQHHLLRQMKALESAGLEYVWTLDIVFSQMKESAPLVSPFHSGWRAVQVWCNGRFPKRRFERFSDTYTVPSAPKQYHEHEQPLPPWKYWLGGLTLPGDLVVDPFCGSATIGVALRDIGGRRYLRTDIDPQNVQVARARLRLETKNDRPGHD
jgi:hypothetical protein